MKLTLSALPHTWILDLDGTLVEHNGYKIYGEDRLLKGVRDFYRSIPEQDYILILTARTEAYRQQTESFLKENGIRYNQIIYNMPMGERVVINDRKPSGLNMAYAINVDRDQNPCDILCNIDSAL